MRYIKIYTKLSFIHLELPLEFHYVNFSFINLTSDSSFCQCRQCRSILQLALGTLHASTLHIYT